MKWLAIQLIGFVAIPALAFWGMTKPFWDGIRLDTSYENSARIRRGMTMSEAERIIGGPPTRDVEVQWGWDKNLSQEWVTSQGRIRVGYIAYRVVASHLRDTSNRNATIPPNAICIRDSQV